MSDVKDGRTALSVAVTCESESAAKLVTLLIDNGASPNQADKDGMSPLLIAAFEGKSQVGTTLWLQTKKGLYQEFL